MPRYSETKVQIRILHGNSGFYYGGKDARYTASEYFHLSVKLHNQFPYCRLQRIDVGREDFTLYCDLQSFRGVFKVRNLRVPRKWLFYLAFPDPELEPEDEDEGCEFCSGGGCDNCDEYNEDGDEGTDYYSRRY